MADNVDVTPGTGATIAADDVGGVLHQVVKLAIGPDGVATLVGNAAPIPVSDAGGSLTVDGTVGVSGTVTVTADGGSITVDGALTDAELRATPVPVSDGGGALTVDGTVAVTDGGGSITVDGTFFQATQPVSDAGGSLTVDGTVAVSAVGGTVSLTDISAGDYETVAASQTDQVLGGAGAVGDYLSGIVIVPATTSAGAVSLKDGAGSAITIFTGGTGSVSNLVPFFVPLGIKSAAGAWKVTTSTNVSAIGVGNFT